MHVRGRVCGQFQVHHQVNTVQVDATRSQIGADRNAQPAGDVKKNAAWVGSQPGREGSEGQRSAASRIGQLEGKLPSARLAASLCCCTAGFKGNGQVGCSRRGAGWTHDEANLHRHPLARPAGAPEVAQCIERLNALQLCALARQVGGREACSQQALRDSLGICRQGQQVLRGPGALKVWQPNCILRCTQHACPCEPAGSKSAGQPANRPAARAR